MCARKRRIGQEPAGAVKSKPAEAVKLSPQVGQGCKESWQCGKAPNKAGCRGLEKRRRVLCAGFEPTIVSARGEEEECICELDAHANFDSNLRHQK